MNIFCGGITTSHQLGRELLSKPDDFLTVTVGEKEYNINCTQLKKTSSNTDDSFVYRTLVCMEN